MRVVRRKIKVKPRTVANKVRVKKQVRGTLHARRTQQKPRQAKVTMKTKQVWEQTQEQKTKHVIMHGPISASKHVDMASGMIIYVFGDYHSKQKVCSPHPQHIDISFIQAIEIAARQHPESIIDAHVEKQTYRKKMKEADPYEVADGQGFLFEDATVELIKKGYLRMSHNNVALSNLHIHVDDVRRLLSRDSHFLTTLSQFSVDIAGTITEKPLSFEKVNSSLDFMEQMIKLMDMSVSHQFNPETIFDDTKINKQIAKLPASASRVLNVLDRWKQEYSMQVNEFNASGGMRILYEILAILNQIGRNPSSFDTWYMKVLPLMTQLMVITGKLRSQILLQDIYMLARLFKHSHRNNIVYVGDLHAQNLRQALNEIGFQQLYSHSHSDNVQCIDLSALHSWPLF